MRALRPRPGARPFGQVRRRHRALRPVECQERRFAGVGPAEAHPVDGHGRRDRRPDHVGQAKCRRRPALGPTDGDGVGIDAELVGVVAQPAHARGGVVGGVGDRGRDALDVVGGAADEAGAGAVAHRHRHVAPAGEGLGVGPHRQRLPRTEPTARQPHDHRPFLDRVARGLVDVEREVDRGARGVGRAAEHDPARDLDLVEHGQPVAVRRRRRRAEGDRRGRPSTLVAVAGDHLAPGRGATVDRRAVPRRERRRHRDVGREPPVGFGLHPCLRHLVARRRPGPAHGQLGRRLLQGPEAGARDGHDGLLGQVGGGVDRDRRRRRQRCVGVEAQLCPPGPRRVGAEVGRHEHARRVAGAAVDLPCGGRHEGADPHLGRERAGGVGRREPLEPDAGLGLVADGGALAHLEELVGEPAARGGDGLPVDEAVGRRHRQRRRDDLGGRVERQRQPGRPRGVEVVALRDQQLARTCGAAVDRSTGADVDDGVEPRRDLSADAVAQPDVGVGRRVALVPVGGSGHALDDRCARVPHEPGGAHGHRLPVTVGPRRRQRRGRGRREGPVGIEGQRHGEARRRAAAGRPVVDAHLARRGAAVHHPVRGLVVAPDGQEGVEADRQVRGAVDHLVAGALVLAPLERRLGARDALQRLEVLDAVDPRDRDPERLAVDDLGAGREVERDDGAARGRGRVARRGGDLGGGGGRRRVRVGSRGVGGRGRWCGVVEGGGRGRRCRLGGRRRCGRRARGRRRGRAGGLLGGARRRHDARSHQPAGERGRDRPPSRPSTSAHRSPRTPRPGASSESAAGRYRNRESPGDPLRRARSNVGP